jgi:hypothetical protein
MLVLIRQLHGLTSQKTIIIFIAVEATISKHTPVASAPNVTIQQLLCPSFSISIYRKACEEQSVFTKESGRVFGLFTAFQSFFVIITAETIHLSIPHPTPPSSVTTATYGIKTVCRQPLLMAVWRGANFHSTFSCTNNFTPISFLCLFS